MADSSSGSGSGTTAPSNERRLESWGEIANYLRREIRTVQRWERNLGLPIHRLPVGKQNAIFAYPSELDRWYKERETRIEKDDLEAQVATGLGSDGTPSVPPPVEPSNGRTTQFGANSSESEKTRKLPWKWIIAGAVLISAIVLLMA